MEPCIFTAKPNSLPPSVCLLSVPPLCFGYEEILTENDRISVQWSTHHIFPRVLVLSSSCRQRGRFGRVISTRHTFIYLIIFIIKLLLTVFCPKMTRRTSFAVFFRLTRRQLRIFISPDGLPSLFQELLFELVSSNRLLLLLMFTCRTSCGNKQQTQHNHGLRVAVTKQAHAWMTRRSSVVSR